MPTARCLWLVKLYFFSWWSIVMLSLIQHCHWWFQLLPNAIHALHWIITFVRDFPLSLLELHLWLFYCFPCIYECIICWVGIVAILSFSSSPILFNRCCIIFNRAKCVIRILFQPKIIFCEASGDAKKVA